MFVCIGEDSTGYVRIIGFNDVVDTVGILLKEGNTYEFQGVMPSPDQRKPEIIVVKVNTRTNIQMVAPMNLVLEQHVNLTDMESCIAPLVKGVVVSIDGKRIILANESGELTVHIKERHFPLQSIDLGNVVTVRVTRVGQRNWCSVMSIEYVTDVAMTTWFKGNENVESMKRRKPNEIRIADIPSFDYGERIKITGIVTKCGISNASTQRGSQVLRMTVGDMSKKCVDVSIFQDTPHPPVKIGEPLSFIASVSNFNVCSLVAKEFESNVPAETSIGTWWETNQTSVLENVNNVYTTPSGVENNENRFNLIGFIRVCDNISSQKMICDETVSIPLSYHANVTDPLSGIVMIRNCKKNSAGAISIFNDTCVEMAQGELADRLCVHFGVDVARNVIPSSSV